MYIVQKVTALLSVRFRIKQTLIPIDQCNVEKSENNKIVYMLVYDCSEIGKVIGKKS